MERVLLISPLPLLPHRPSKPLHLQPRRSLCISSAASGGSSGDTSPTTADAPTDAPPTQTSTPPSGSKPTSVKNRLRARNQARRVPEVSPAPVEISMKATKSKSASAASAPPRREKQRSKKWEEMDLAEKAVELYVGEKGLLFWLNKFAYASIFIMVGAWILFRFVGPSIGLYQLDAPPLPPTAVFAGSS
ncbi:hypothetical protein ABZP36_020926 [Zizania latifolia]